MSLFKGSYLRVLTPCTTDGTSPMMDEDGRIVKKETFLPVSAKRDLDIQNKYLPDILKKTIQLVTEEQATKDTKTVAPKK